MRKFSVEDVVKLLKYFDTSSAKVAAEFREKGDEENFWYFQGRSTGVGDVVAILARPEAWEEFLHTVLDEGSETTN